MDFKYSLTLGLLLLLLRQHANQENSPPVRGKGGSVPLAFLSLGSPLLKVPVSVDPLGEPS
jgi:hypothetical protein